MKSHTLLSFTQVSSKGVKTLLRAFLCIYHVLLLVIRGVTLTRLETVTVNSVTHKKFFFFSAVAFLIN